MPYQISLEVFEGPLDLLLHLIRKNKLDIYDIPISLVADQYIEYIEAMKELDMDVASEFLVTASTLLAIKAKMLLPKHEEEEEIEEDPRLELVARLLEYQKYKSVVDVFQSMEKDNARIYAKPVDEALVEALSAQINPLESVTFDDLSQLFLQVLERVPPIEETTEIVRRSLTISDVIKTLEAGIKEKKTMYFHEVFDELNHRYELVIYFLALLELLRKGTVAARQAESCGPIYLTLMTGKEI